MMEILRDRQDVEPHYTGECVLCKTIVRAARFEVYFHTYHDPYGYKPSATIPECQCPNCGTTITLYKEGGEK